MTRRMRLERDKRAGRGKKNFKNAFSEDGGAGRSGLEGMSKPPSCLVMDGDVFQFDLQD